MKGISEEEFDPLELFQEAQKRVPKLSWTLPENESLRKRVIDFLEYN